MIKLRGHHLFCTTLFQGFGYSEDFAKNMTKTIEKFETDEIKMVESFDDVCKACPHKSADGICTNGMENVLLRDKNALKALGLKVGDTFNKKELFEKLATIDNEAFNSVCHHCQWGLDGLCSYEKFKEKVI